MQTAAQLWLVYKMTGSAALLGVFGFASQVPILFWRRWAAISATAITAITV